MVPLIAELRICSVGIESDVDVDDVGEEHVDGSALKRFNLNANATFAAAFAIAVVFAGCARNRDGIEGVDVEATRDVEGGEAGVASRGVHGADADVT